MLRDRKCYLFTFTLGHSSSVYSHLICSKLCQNGSKKKLSLLPLICFVLVSCNGYWVKPNKPTGIVVSLLGQSHPGMSGCVVYTRPRPTLHSHVYGVETLVSTNASRTRFTSRILAFFNSFTTHSTRLPFYAILLNTIL